MNKNTDPMQGFLEQLLRDWESGGAKPAVATAAASKPEAPKTPAGTVLPTPGRVSSVVRSLPELADAMSLSEVEPPTGPATGAVPFLTDTAQAAVEQAPAPPPPPPPSQPVELAKPTFSWKPAPAPASVTPPPPPTPSVESGNPTLQWKPAADQVAPRETPAEPRVAVPAAAQPTPESPKPFFQWRPSPPVAEPALQAAVNQPSVAADPLADTVPQTPRTALQWKPAASPPPPAPPAARQQQQEQQATPPAAASKPAFLWKPALAMPATPVQAPVSTSPAAPPPALADFAAALSALKATRPGKPVEMAPAESAGIPVPTPPAQPPTVESKGDLGFRAPALVVTPGAGKPSIEFVEAKPETTFHAVVSAPPPASLQPQFTEEARIDFEPPKPQFIETARVDFEPPKPQFAETARVDFEPPKPQFIETARVDFEPPRPQFAETARVDFEPLRPQFAEPAYSQEEMLPEAAYQTDDESLAPENHWAASEEFPPASPVPEPVLEQAPAVELEAEKEIEAVPLPAPAIEQVQNAELLSFFQAPASAAPPKPASPFRSILVPEFQTETDWDDAPSVQNPAVASKGGNDLASVVANLEQALPTGQWDLEEATSRRIELQRHLVFAINDDRYAVSLENLLEIDNMPNWTGIPGLPASVRGLINLRGEIVSLLELRAILGLSYPEIPKKGKIFVATTSDRQAVSAFAVDEIEGIFGFDQANLTPLPALTSNAQAKGITATIEEGNRLIRILDVGTILSDVEKSFSLDQVWM